MAQQTIKSIKQTAREALMPNWNRHGLLILVYFALNLAAAFFIGSMQLTTNQSTILYIGISLIFQLLDGLLLAGIFAYLLHVLRKQDAGIGDLFYAFRNQPDRYLIVGIIQLALQLVFFAPAYISLFVTDNGNGGNEIIFICLALVGCILTVFMKLGLAFSCFLLLDHEEMGAVESIRQSLTLMNGKKGRLFKLTLSFFGIFLLCLTSLGIGFVWAVPYYLTSAAVFYNSPEAA